MIQISVILLVIGNSAGPVNGDLQEIYFDTCQESCDVVKNDEDIQGCREKFCPNYVSYILTGLTVPGASPSLVSSHRKQVADFCATWMVHLIQELGWQRRNRLNLKECACAAGKDCLV
ncbi:unnamed protein product [Adineta steineri]|uniref:Uncharacterized protein n=1 Tax=Adineta steineri TaxID=433720 RepID=A0A814KSK2_9BILA|nr:unnamed protein product [Adineta steineri]CAF0913921.1 unnamed protein product [Adineta steineri]CAF1055494.1 unnamed protein product [Adineta steineri]CAF3589566.1 unnamed protein product [Adineta steineri]CAF3918999.1 unnamed protein product [Adineta steineri]